MLIYFGEKKKKRFTNNKNIGSACEDGVIAENAFNKWFANLKSRNYGRPETLIFQIDRLITNLDQRTGENIGEAFYICHMSVLRQRITNGFLNR